MQRRSAATLAPLAPHDRPLNGVWVLDLTRVLAGPVAGRTLAAYGADAMLDNSPHLPNIDEAIDHSPHKPWCEQERIPQWQPSLTGARPGQQICPHQRGCGQPAGTPVHLLTTDPDITPSA